MNNLEKVQAAVEYIEAHLTQKLDLDAIAAAVHYSKYHLHRMFSKAVGLTIYEYAKRRQLTEAAKLLIFSNKPVLDIAILAGYESQQAFTTKFKAMYKKSPNQFRESEIFYPLQLKFELEGTYNMLGLGGVDLLSRISFATEEDIPCWMELVRLVIDGFPYLDKDEHVQTLTRYIRLKQALILKDGDLAIGTMLFSYDSGSIEFFGVHPLYRQQGIAKALLDKVMEEMLADSKVISTTTYREGDKADTGHRKTLMELGFSEAELLVEFGYPTQRFIIPNKVCEEKAANE